MSRTTTAERYRAVIARLICDAEMMSGRSFCRPFGFRRDARRKPDESQYRERPANKPNTWQLVLGGFGLGTAEGGGSGPNGPAKIRGSRLGTGSRVLSQEGNT